MERWNEICFILKGSLPSNINEQLYESKVVQAFEKLGWSQYKGEISVRETIPFGAANRMNPDVIIKTIEKENLFVVEIKKPSANVDYHGFEDQLSSYMRMLKLNVGVLIGSKIKIYVDGSLVNSQRLILIDEIEFHENNDEGLNFINIFGKSDNPSEKIKDYIHSKIKSIKFNNTKSKLLKEILSSDVEVDIKDMIRTFYANIYDKGIVDEVLNEVTINILQKGSASSDHSFNSPSINKPFRDKNIKEIKTLRNIVENPHKPKSTQRANIRKVINLILNTTGVHVDKSNANLSTINANGIYSVEPNLNRINNNWYLILINTRNKTIYVFNIPSNHFIYNKLYKRDDKDVYRLLFNVDDSNFEEKHAHERFDRFLEGECKYAKDLLIFN